MGHGLLPYFQAKANDSQHNFWCLFYCLKIQKMVDLLSIEQGKLEPAGPQGPSCCTMSYTLSLRYILRKGATRPGIRGQAFANRHEEALPALWSVLRFRLPFQTSKVYHFLLLCLWTMDCSPLEGWNREGGMTLPNLAYHRVFIYLFIACAPRKSLKGIKNKLPQWNQWFQLLSPNILQLWS